MSANFNVVIIAGNVTRDPELRFVGANKTANCELSVAINDRRKGANGEWVEETTYVDVVVWGRTAEVAAEYAKKGTGVLVDGRLKLDTWQDKTSGEKRSKLRVVCERMQLLGGKPQGERGNTPPARQQPSQQDSFVASDVPDEDIPF